VYITNIVEDGCRSTVTPTGEILAYGPFLDRQISIIRPRVIVTLGRYAMGYIMEKFGLSAQLEPISRMHGRQFETKADYGPISVVPLYHPAVAIYNRSSLDTLRQDFQVLRQYATIDSVL
jgi:DNA polymerase